MKMGWLEYDWWSGLFDTSPEFWVYNDGKLVFLIYAEEFGSW